MPRRSPPALQLQDALGLPRADKRLEILRLVAGAGSISQAARDAGVSYKAAWQALDTLANLAGVPLVEKAVGGTGGGGARLTDAGRQVLAAAGALSAARQEVLGRLAPDAAARVSALHLRTSMRNQLPATVASLARRSGAVEVGLQLPGGAFLRSRITVESAQLLGLARGQRLLALCKATAVAVRAGTGAGVNELAGEVARGTRARGGGEVALALPGGQQLVGFSPGPMRVGEPAVAVVEPAAVVVALAG